MKRSKSEHKESQNEPYNSVFDETGALKSPANAAEFAAWERLPTLKELDPGASSVVTQYMGLSGMAHKASVNYVSFLKSRANVWIKKHMNTPQMGYKYFTEPWTRAPYILFDDSAWRYYAVALQSRRTSVVYPLAMAAMSEFLSVSNSEVAGGDQTERLRNEEQLLNFRMKIATSLETFVHDLNEHKIPMERVMEQFVRMTQSLWEAERIPANAVLRVIQLITPGVVDVRTFDLFAGFVELMMEGFMEVFLEQGIEVLPYVIRGVNVAHMWMCWVAFKSFQDMCNSRLTIVEIVCIYKFVGRLTDAMSVTDLRVPSNSMLKSYRTVLDHLLTMRFDRETKVSLADIVRLTSTEPPWPKRLIFSVKGTEDDADAAPRYIIADLGNASLAIKSLLDGSALFTVIRNRLSIRGDVTFKVFIGEIPFFRADRVFDLDADAPDSRLPATVR